MAIFLTGYFGCFVVDRFWPGYYYVPITQGKNVWLFTQLACLILYGIGVVLAFAGVRRATYAMQTGTNTMIETVAIARPPVARAAVSRRSAKPVTVGASALAQHLDCSRTYIGKFEADGVIQRQGDGFPLDQSRIAYLRYLRRERQQSPGSGADKVKTERCSNCA